MKSTFRRVWKEFFAKGEFGRRGREASQTPLCKRVNLQEGSSDRGSSEGEEGGGEHKNRGKSG